MDNYLSNSAFFFILLIFMGCKSGVKKLPSEEVNSETKEDSKTKSLELLVGTFTNGESKGIYKLDFDPRTGALGNKMILAENENPGYIAISKNTSKVYSSNAGKPGSISVYGFNDDRSHLNKANDHPSEGDGACFIELNPSENLLAAANYGSGNIVVYRLNGEGNIIGDAQSRTHSGNGPHPNQKSAHAHCVKFDASGKFLYAVDLGIDEIVAYSIDSEGNLGAQQTALALDAGDGPRHLIFHPIEDMAFVINELSSTVVSLTVNSETGRFDRIDKKSSLPKNFDGSNACADIHLSKDGKFLYASNRGHNSIAIFSVSDKGKLQLVATEPVQGDWPRNFTLSPDGKILLVANQKSDNITVFKVDTNTGRLSYTGNQIGISQPVCLKF